MDPHSGERALKMQAARIVRGFAPLVGESYSAYLKRLRTHVGTEAWREMAKYYREAACTIHLRLFPELDPAEFGVKQIKVKKKLKKGEEKRLVMKHLRKTYGQIPLSTSTKATWLKGYLNNRFKSTGYQCTFGGKKVTVYELSTTQWGYPDMSHGEIEVISANSTSGSTLGFCSLLFDFSQYERGKGKGSDVTYDLDNVTILPLVAGKLHTYTLTH